MAANADHQRKILSIHTIQNTKECLSVRTGLLVSRKAVFGVNP